ncbi:MAG: hypothetical protein NBKEAIPA_01184 [Nitrospirae bacterium]|nr:MAG: ComE operon protein 1 [Nitrospira sp. OLB3]MBV6469294.1 hypothetical protein [Nitrospirota bacterium]MCK6492494.1 ComEA family DNA-binding protein [Nitrospira sp.]MEB2337837.1 ComEA family DNA-binding protein [Nitrospirales bacterium]QOJ37002.1 MAG: helix-hairpin-helix domain-containing protein [Nitrospira sp.]
MGRRFILRADRLEMLQSFLIKLAMVGVTLGALIWIGSVAPANQTRVMPLETAEPVAAQVAVQGERHSDDVNLPRQVDLNEATQLDLETLPGIGPKLAQRILDHRLAHGSFERIEDLRQVKGIGQKTFERLRPHVLVSRRATSPERKGTL